MKVNKIFNFGEVFFRKRGLFLEDYSLKKAQREDFFYIQSLDVEKNHACCLENEKRLYSTSSIRISNNPLECNFLWKRPKRLSCIRRTSRGQLAKRLSILVSTTQQYSLCQGRSSIFPLKMTQLSNYLIPFHFSNGGPLRNFFTQTDQSS